MQAGLPRDTAARECLELADARCGGNAGHFSRIQTHRNGQGRARDFCVRTGYVYCGNVKYTDHAFNKTTIYKRNSRNHLVEQVESFRIGDKDKKLENDLLDTFCYGIAIGLGNSDGF